MPGSPIVVRNALVTSLIALACGLVWATTVNVEVAPDQLDVFEALAAAYAAGVERSDRDVDLVLALGRPDWRDADTVAVTSETIMILERDTPAAREFMRFATSAAGQRSLIRAGLLPERVTIVDQEGRSVELAQPVERLASPYALATYLAYAVGAGDRVVLGNYLGARDPEGAAAMERIDPRFRELGTVAPEDATNVEYVATIAPDLVFAAAGAEWRSPLEALGIAVIAFQGESPERLREALRIAGRALGPDAAARAEAWIAYYDDVLDRVEQAVGPMTRRPTVLFTGTDRTRVASGAMYQTALIEAAGGASVTAHLRGHWNDVDVEQVLSWNPDVVLVAPYGRATVAAILEDATWQLLDAVRTGDVLRVPKLVAPWDTPVPDSVLALVWLAERLHGELVDLDCEAETHFFYRRFYDYQIEDEEVAVLCGG
jgi:iron complex transport system substrate-binding protein